MVTFRAACFVLIALALGATTALAQPTAFTYQGDLRSAGQPANGLHDLRFRLFDAPSGGTQVGSTQCVDNVSVTDGTFTTTIDFGPQFPTTAARFVEIDVRTNTGLNCATATGFTVVSPRQQVTAAPRAQAASVASALAAPDGSPANAVIVDNNGSVGVNTATPLSRLHVTAAAVGDGIRLTGTSGADPGFLFFNGATQRGAIGLATSATNWGQDAAANDIVFRAESGGKLLLQSGPFTSALTINSVNNVGIGTAAPAAKLDVRGDIRLGANGQLRATSGEENLRIIRGSIFHSGSITAGSGFTVSPNGDGQYTINFTTPFTGRPSVTASLDGVATELSIEVQASSSTSATVVVYIIIAGIRNEREHAFNFIAVGPR
jgi:hypothetical protein